MRLHGVLLVSRASLLPRRHDGRVVIAREAQVIVLFAGVVGEVVHHVEHAVRLGEVVLVVHIAVEAVARVAVSRPRGVGRRALRRGVAHGQILVVAVAHVRVGDACGDEVLRSQVVAGHGRASEALPVAVRAPVLSEGGAVVVESLCQGLLRLRAVHVAEIYSGVHAQAVEAGHDARHQAQFPVVCLVGVIVLVDYAIKAVHFVGIDAEHILVVPVAAFGHELQRHLLEGLGGQGFQRLVNHFLVAEERVLPSVAHDEERRIGVVHIEPSVRRALHHGYLVEYLVQVHCLPVGVLREVVDNFGRRHIDKGLDDNLSQMLGSGQHFDLSQRDGFILSVERAART